MKTIHLACITIAAGILAAVPLRAAVNVNTAEPKEKRVAFQVSAKQFITASPSNSLDFAGAKIGSRQTFTLVDLNGRELEDGHRIKIQYIPNSGGMPDPTKASYWVEMRAGVKRGRDGDTFKIKKVGAKYAIMTSGGKYVAGLAGGGMLGLTDKQEGALLVEIIDPSAPKAPKPVAAEEPAAPAASAPAGEKPAAE